MNTKLLTGILFAALASAVAARPESKEAAVPTSGVVVPAAPAPDASAPLVAVAPAPAETNAVTQIVHSPTLPTVAELKAAAEAQGLRLERVVQTQIQVIAFFRNAQGQETTVAYQTTPPTGTAAPAPVDVTQPAVVTAPPAVVYQQAPQVIYADAPYYPYYYGYSRPVYAAPYYPPVSLSLGFVFGSRGGYYGGHYHWR